MKNRTRFILGGLGLLFVGIQFVPVDRSNPPVTQEVRWDAPETRALAQQACFDCHSNETTWPWYAYVAPISWRVAGHVEDGRRHLNFSAWDQPNEDVEEIEEVVREGEMPLWDYVLLHGEARLTEAEQETLLNGLRATYEADPEIPRRRPQGPPAN